MLRTPPVQPVPASGGAQRSAQQRCRFPRPADAPGSRPAALRRAGGKSAPAASCCQLQAPPALVDTHAHMLRVSGCNIWLALRFVVDAKGSPRPPRPGQVLQRERSSAKNTPLRGHFPGSPLLFELSASTRERAGADRSWEPLRAPGSGKFQTG